MERLRSGTDISYSIKYEEAQRGLAVTNVLFVWSLISLKIINLETNSEYI
jgi:hypothetical protein